MAHYVKVVGDTPTHSAREIEPEESGFQRYITYGDIRRGSPPARALKCSAFLSLAKIWHISRNLETVQDRR